MGDTSGIDGARRTGRSRRADAERFAAEPDGTERNGTEPNSTGRNGTEPNSTGRNRTEPNSTGRNSTGRSWVERADGDRRARARLRLLGGDDGVIVLNDRRMPGSRHSIKLIAVSSSGVYVIDTKHYRGLAHTKRRGTLADLGPHELHVGRHNCTPSVLQLAGQMEVVRGALDVPWGGDVPIHGMLCLTRADWGFACAIQLDQVWVGWPTLMAGQVRVPGPMDSPTVQEVSMMIAQHLPTA